MPSRLTGAPTGFETSRRVVADASVLAALVFGEPRATEAADAIEGAVVHAPTLLAYELTNVAWKKARRDAHAAPGIFRALAEVLDDRAAIVWQTVSPSDAALISLATGLSTYDASYLWLAGYLGADLVTFDERLAAAAV